MSKVPRPEDFSLEDEQQTGQNKPVARYRNQINYLDLPRIAPQDPPPSAALQRYSSDQGYRGETSRHSGYFTTTCPSHNKLNPDLSSRAILSEFLSRPDDVAQPNPWLRQNISGERRLSNDSTVPSASASNLPYGPRRLPDPLMRPASALSSGTRIDLEVRAQPTRMVSISGEPQVYREHQFDHHHQVNHSRHHHDPSSHSRNESALAENVARNESTTENFAGPSIRSPVASTSNFLYHPVVSRGTSGEEFRCRDCNRKCKSEASFQKHAASCTHRAGPLTLECRYCKRPYTYIGYLMKHEAECVKLHAVSLSPN